MTDLTVSSRIALQLMDLTSLNDDDTPQKIIDLCQRAGTPAGNTAAVCVYPKVCTCCQKDSSGTGPERCNGSHGHQLSCWW